MSNSPKPDLTLLGPALAAGRAALRRMEDTEVPANLRRVAAYSGGRLPPPLAKALVDALDENSWLRAKAVEELQSPLDGSEPERASALFLERPSGWWDALGALSASSDAAGLRRSVQEAERARAQAEARVEEVTGRAKAERARCLTDLEAARREIKDLKAQLRRPRESERADEQKVRAEFLELERQLAAVEADLVAAERSAARLRRQLRSLRDDRARIERKLRAEQAGSVRDLEPLDEARRLDELSRLAIGAPAAPPVRAAAAVPGLTLPAGIRPDGPGAVDWLLGQGEPALLLVDGYNISFQLMDEEFSSPRARRHLNQELGRMAALAHAALHVVVVYDSSLADGRERATGPRGVEVVFAPEGTLADTEIVVRAEHAAGGAVAVISSDREVRDGAEHAGALPLWGEALVDWLRRRV